MSFEKSASNLDTTEILGKTQNTTRRQWIRGVRANLIRPQLYSNQKTKIAELALLEFSDPGVLVSIILDVNFPRLMNYFLSLKLKDIRSLLDCPEEKWKPHSEGDLKPFWEPKFDDRKNGLPVGYVFVSDPETESDTASDCPDQTEYSKEQPRRSKRQKSNPKNDEIHRTDDFTRMCRNDFNIFSKIDAIGERKIMKRIREIFQVDPKESDIRARKKASLCPLQFVPFHTLNGEKVYTDGGDDDDHTDPTVYHPFREFQYKSVLKQGNIYDN